MAVVTVTAGSSFTFSPPVILPPAGLMGPGTFNRNFDILRDGSGFIGRQVRRGRGLEAGCPAAHPRRDELVRGPEPPTSGPLSPHARSGFSTSTKAVAEHDNLTAVPQAPRGLGLGRLARSYPVNLSNQVNSTS